ncbi:hypothetical protein [Streptomyces sp. NPDC047928]|uniref:hypothetical protein n=1 Tax=unclassified Streptomyces TaxID=2593676 RepID=UPI00371F4407
MSVRLFAGAWRPQRHFAYQVMEVSTLVPARSANSVWSTPAFSQAEGAECRRS